MAFRVCSHTQTKIVFRAQKSNQVGCMGKAFRMKVEIFLIVRDISPDDKDILYPHRQIAIHYRNNLLWPQAIAGKIANHIQSFFNQEFFQQLPGALAGGTTSAEGHRHKIWFQVR